MRITRQLALVNLVLFQLTTIALLCMKGEQRVAVSVAACSVGWDLVELVKILYNS